MCGIAGIIYADRHRPVDPAILKAMGDAIAHRGPDAEGFWTEPGSAWRIAGCRSSTWTAATSRSATRTARSRSSSTARSTTTRSFGESLKPGGTASGRSSDTEVLVHLYEEMGDRLVERLRGMFAFALWDRTERRLLLARDRLGLKPLYFYRDAEKLLFGSELKAILAYPGVHRQVDPAALEDYLAFGMVAGDRSIFQQHRKAAAGTRAERRPTTSSSRAPRRYWQLRIEPDDRPTVDEWQEAIRHKLDETTRLHLIADVPVGAFLSGGIDSSIIVALTAGATQGPLQTFSIGFAEERFSELPYATRVAERFGTRHTEEIVTPDAVSLVDELTHYYDEPFADSSAIPTFLVSRLASQHVKVVLSGDGGDEAFGGYSRYAHDLKEAALRRRLPGWLRRSVLRPLAQVWPKADWLPRPLRAKTMLTNLSLDAGPAYANTLSLVPAAAAPPADWPGPARAAQRARPGQLDPGELRHGPSGDALGGMIAADADVILPDDFLVKVDRASMAHGLEVRPPLVDHELMELAARIPSSWKVHDGETKWILKQAFKDVLPDAILRRPKQGFEIPIDAWLRGPLRPMFESSVLDPKARVAGLVDQVARPEALRLPPGWHRAGMGNVLWSLLVLAKWADRYLG